MTARQKEFWTGIFFLSFGLATFYIALGYGLWAGRAVGSGLFPAALGVILGIFGIVLIIQAFLIKAKEQGSPWSLRPILLICASLVAFAVLVEKTGLLLALAVTVIIVGFADKPVFKYLVAVYAIVVIFVFAFLMQLLNLPYKLY